MTTMINIYFHRDAAMPETSVQLYSSGGTHWAGVQIDRFCCSTFADTRDEARAWLEAFRAKIDEALAAPAPVLEPPEPPEPDDFTDGVEIPF